MKIITINTSEGPMEVKPAWLNQDFAVHVDEFGNNPKFRTYAVTHLKTGLKTIDGFAQKRYAVEFATRLSQAVMPVPWDAITTENMKRTAPANVSTVFEILEATETYCRETWNAKNIRRR